MTGAAATLVARNDSAIVQTVETDDLGYFVFRDLVPGSYRLSLARLGFALYETDVTVAAASTDEFEVTMTPTPDEAR